MERSEDTITMTQVPTYWASIYVGFKKGYDGGFSKWQDVVEKSIQPYVDSIGLCVTVETVNFFYTEGNENGIKVGLINYPRFPNTSVEIRVKAMNLAQKLMLYCEQMRVTVVFPDETFMLSNDTLAEEYLKKKNAV